MTAKEEFLQFINEIETPDGLISNIYTIEKPAFLNGQSMMRQWFFPKQEIIDLISNNFDDDLNGHFNDQDNTLTKIEEWGILNGTQEISI